MSEVVERGSALILSAESVYATGVSLCAICQLVLLASVLVVGVPGGGLRYPFPVRYLARPGQTVWAAGAQMVTEV